MGYGPVPQEMIRDLAAKLPQGFSVLELGDQMYTTERYVGRTKMGQPKQKWKRAPASEMFKALGGGRYETIDANGKASILHDLNLPLPDLEPFDLVTNAGTTEHVFDQARCWTSIHDLAKPQGYIFAEQPCYGYPDHGFYCLQPTFFKDLARHNDYRIECFRVDETPRGKVVRVIYQRMTGEPFRIPTQGRYRTMLKC